MQSNLFNTDTKGTEPIIRFTEVSVFNIEVGKVGFLAFLVPNKLSVIERCPYYRGVSKDRLDCSCQNFPKVSLLKSSNPKTYLTNFPPPKKSLDHPRHLKSRVPPWVSSCVATLLSP